MFVVKLKHLKHYLGLRLSGPMLSHKVAKGKTTLFGAECTRGKDSRRPPDPKLMKTFDSGRQIKIVLHALRVSMGVDWYVISHWLCFMDKWW